MSALQKRIQMSKLPPMPPPGIGRGGMAGGAKKPFGRRRSYTPITWDNYFDKLEDVKVDENNIFRIYLSGDEGPVCLFLHGGGFSALSWAVLSKTLVGLVKCRCAALDLRGHGDSKTSDEQDLSADTLARDVGNVVNALYGDSPPPIILVGHSMGGAIAVHVASQGLVPSLLGLTVIDVVEGTALEALNSMQSFLRSRPTRFKSLEHAIEWCVRTGQTRNLESARVSMVGQVKRLSTNETATSEIESTGSANETAVTSQSNVIQEEEEEDEGGQNKRIKPSPSPEPEFRHPSTVPSSSESQYTWRIDLANTEKYWRGWFEGLSQRFLSCPGDKLLLLAGVDRLDKDLTVGQMQGKFQMQVLPQCGHAVHEDKPDTVAEVLATYMVRHKYAEATADFQRPFPSC